LTRKPNDSINLKLSVILRNYVNPIAEGQTQAANSIIECLSLSAIDLTVYSLGYPRGASLPLNNVKDPRIGKTHILFDPIKQLKYLNTDKLGFLFRKNYELLNALNIATRLSAADYVYLLNVPHKTYGFIFKSINKLKRATSKTVFHVFHQVSIGIPFEHKLCDVIFCGNKTSYVYFSNNFNKKTYYVPYPININKFKPRKKDISRLKLGLPLNVCIIGYIGKINPIRGIFDLIKVMSDISNIENDVLLVIVSPYTPPWFKFKPESTTWEETLHNMINVPNLRTNVILIQEKIPIELFYNAVDFLVLPYNETHLPIDPPVSLIEAMSSGVPVITTAVGELRDVVKDTRGILIPPRNREALKTEMLRLIRNPDASKGYGLKARDYVVENLSLEIMEKKMTRIFQEMDGA